MSLLPLIGQTLVSGIAIGGVYVLVALGIVLIYRATRVVNFAQGEFTMLGAYALFALLAYSGLPYLVCIIIGIIIMAIIGFLFQLGIYYPLRNRTKLPIVIATIGASTMLQNGALVVFGPSPQKVASIVSGDSSGIKLGGVFFDYQYIIIIVVTVFLVVFQYFFFEHTMLGKKIQAAAQDKDMTRLLGIPLAAMIAITFIYSTALGGLSGMLIAPIFFVQHKMGAVLGVKAFAASICGGFGDVRGAIIGGFTIGIIESFGATFISSIYKDAFALLVLILFLLIRPQGLFGEKVSEKA